MIRVPKGPPSSLASAQLVLEFEHDANTTAGSAGRALA
jgi:hypothetical protein